MADECQAAGSINIELGQDICKASSTYVNNVMTSCIKLLTFSMYSTVGGLFVICQCFHCFDSCLKILSLIKLLSLTNLLTYVICSLIQTTSTTHSSSVITLKRPLNPSRLQVTNRSLYHSDPDLWNTLFEELVFIILVT
jgi:hypothetical protein